MKIFQSATFRVFFAILSCLSAEACIDPGVVNQTKGSLLRADTAILKPINIGCRDIFVKALPFPLHPFDASIDDHVENVRVFSAGGAGVVLKNKDNTKVYKIVHSTDGLDPSIQLDNRQKELFKTAKDLFKLEKDLFIDFAHDTKASGEFASYLVPSKLVTLKYGDRIFEAIEKEYITGFTMDEIYRLQPELFKKNGELKNLLENFYESYKNVMNTGHRISDIRDPNLIYSPGRSQPIVLIDGVYDGYLPPDEVYPFFDFPDLCSPHMWCKASYSEDLEFADLN
jgi:hypothetical protein